LAQLLTSVVLGCSQGKAPFQRSARVCTSCFQKMDGFQLHYLIKYAPGFQLEISTEPRTGDWHAFCSPLQRPPELLRRTLAVCSAKNPRPAAPSADLRVLRIFLCSLESHMSQPAYAHSEISTGCSGTAWGLLQAKGKNPESPCPFQLLAT